MSIEIKITQLHIGKEFNLPSYSTVGSAGMDLYAAIEAPYILKAGAIAIIPAGIAIALPAGYEAQIRSRSGLAAKHGITILNSPGTIDSDYRGEIASILINHSKTDFIIEKGMRVAQMVIAKYEHTNWYLVNDLGNTERGANGFGSTGLTKLNNPLTTS